MKPAIVAAFVAILTGLTFDARAQIIDFESTPSGGTPIDDEQLGVNDTYIIGDVEVTFGFDTNSNGTADVPAEFELIGGGPPLEEAFYGFAALGYDTANPGFESQLGTWFIRSPSGSNFEDFGVLVITYGGTGIATAAGGEIWDIDGSSGGGSEKYELKAFDNDGTQVFTIESPEYQETGPNNSLNGRPWSWSFSGMPSGIERIEIRFKGSKGTPEFSAGLIGLAFNNFNATGAVSKALPALSQAKIAALSVILVGIGLFVTRSIVVRVHGVAPGSTPMSGGVDS